MQLEGGLVGGGLWIASPAASSLSQERIFCVGIGGTSSEGDIGVVEYDYGYNGLRPIVCLKPDVKLEKNDDGSYTIVENEETPGGDTGEGTEDEISSADVPATDYGAIVNGYDCTNSAAVNNWKLFYADDNNIYLIADDYIYYNYIPANSKGHKPTGYQYSAATMFEQSSRVLMDYRGSSDITDPRIKALNNDYFNVKRYSSYEENMRAIAYMLDIDTWSVYAGEYADYAIGVPTLELFLKSYNEKYGTNYIAEAVTAPYGSGYTIKNGGDTVTGYGTNLNNIDSLYIITSTSKASEMYLASPAPPPTNAMCVVNNGYLGPVDIILNDNPIFGFRPIVCLKSDVKLQKNDDGSYTIVSEGTNEGETLEKIEILMPSSVGVNYGETVRVTASNAQEDYTYHVYKANSLTGNGEEVKHSRLSISISGRVLTFTITGFIEQDEGYYYLVVETPDGLKESTSRTHIYFNS